MGCCWHCWLVAEMVWFGQLVRAMPCDVRCTALMPTGLVGRCCCGTPSGLSQTALALPRVHSHITSHHITTLGMGTSSTELVVLCRSHYARELLSFSRLSTHLVLHTPTHNTALHRPRLNTLTSSASGVEFSLSPIVRSHYSMRCKIEEVNVTSHFTLHNRQTGGRADDTRLISISEYERTECSHPRDVHTAQG